MKKEIDTSDSTSAANEAAGPMCGERLAKARREQQIPTIEIAKELHLDEYKVKALESNDFDVIGAPVFAKGHLRKYAQLVKVAEEDVMADYYQLSRTSGAQPAISLRPKPRKEVAPGPWVAAIIVIFIVAAAYWWFSGANTSSVPPTTGEIAPLPASEIDLISTEEMRDDDSNADDIVSDTAEKLVAEERSSIAVAAEVPDDSGLSLSVSFSGDCWTEITDASGRRLFFGLGASGRTVNVSGEAPFNALFGDAANVTLEVNGTPYEITAGDRRGRTARLTITGS